MEQSDFEIGKKLSFLHSDAFRDLVSFLQFKKREKFPWRSVTFRKAAG